MPFVSVTFLFCFLPLTLLIGFVLPMRARNVWLFAMSLLFFAWPDPAETPILIAYIALNWLGGFAVSAPGRTRFLRLSLAVAANLGGLAWFKYSNLWRAPAVAAARWLHWRLDVPQMVLPYGISFYTFHAISYLVDIYRGEASAFANPLDLGLYLAFFPQLIAGPIARFRDLAPQIRRRVVTEERFATGTERFLFGMSKKLLIADPVGLAASHVFALPASDLSTANAWFGLLCYTVQIYFDFSGYSDMAVGLGLLFGFELPENFRYPYAARSMRDFWRRWHISLSTWFRDYLYIPLGGNRGRGIDVAWRLFTVFLLCGIWHGPTINFALWGLFHGFFLAIERGSVGRWLGRLPAPLAHAYVVLAVAAGWVLFRADTLAQAGDFYLTLLGLRSGSSYGNAMIVFYTAKTLVPLAAGIVLSAPVFSFLSADAPGPAFVARFRFALVCALFVLSTSFVAAETFHPFLYFQF